MPPSHAISLNYPKTQRERGGRWGDDKQGQLIKLPECRRAAAHFDRLRDKGQRITMPATHGCNTHTHRTELDSLKNCKTWQQVQRQFMASHLARAATTLHNKTHDGCTLMRLTAQWGRRVGGQLRGCYKGYRRCRVREVCRKFVCSVCLN